MYLSLYVSQSEVQKHRENLSGCNFRMIYTGMPMSVVSVVVDVVKICWERDTHLETKSYTAVRMRTVENGIQR